MFENNDQVAPVLFGLLAGTFAKFGRMLATDTLITIPHVLGHVMMMGVCALVASIFVSYSHITDPNTIAFTSAVLAIAASDVIQWLSKRAWQRFLVETIEESEHAVHALQDVRGEIRQNEQMYQSINHLDGDQNDPKIPS